MNKAGKNRAPGLSDVQRFWEAHVNNEYYTRSERGSERYFAQIERRRYRWHYHLVDLFRELEGNSGRLLEIGCGIGVDSIQLARAGFDVTGVDLTESAIDVAERFAEHHDVAVRFLQSNAEDLEFTADSFDVVYSFGVLHHTPNIERAIREIRRVLVPGGRAYVMLYHRHSLVDLVHRIGRLPYESPRSLKDHCPVVHTFSRREAAELFGGFREVQIEAAYPFTYGFRYVCGWMPRSLVRWLGGQIGWHLMIRARK